MYLLVPHGIVIIMKNKFCRKCGRECKDYEKFCPNCGMNEFVTDDFEETTILNHNSANSNNEQTIKAAPPVQNPQQEHFQQYQPNSFNAGSNNTQLPQKKKGLKGWQIALIVVGVLILAVIGFVAEKTFQNEGYGSNTASDNTFTIGKQNESGAISYSKGDVQDGYYSNEWANIKFKLTEEWPESDENVYSNYENRTTDCGFISLDELSGKQFAVQFEDLSAYVKSYSANDYLKAFAEQLNNQYKNNNIEFDISEIFDINIAGDKYSAIKTHIVHNGMCMYNCCKIVDKHAVIITVSSYDENIIEDTLAQIKEY